MKTVWLFCLVLVSSAFADQTQQLENGLRQVVVIKNQPVQKHSILERMKYYQVPGLSIAVIDHGKIVWTKAYGVKEHKNGKNDPVTTETLFQAGSVSKPIAALGTLYLVQHGLLSLDQNVNDYLKSWKVPENEFTKKEKVTLRRILSHSAGLTVHGFPGYEQGVRLPTLVDVLNGKKPEVNTDRVFVDTVPGSRWRYSGGGITIEQLLIEDVTGKSFASWMKKTVLNPIGMTKSTYEQPLSREYESLASSGHQDGFAVVPGRWHNYPEAAAAGLWTNPTDLAKAIIEIQQAYHGIQGSLLNSEMTKEMLTTQKDPSGLGPMVRKTKDGIVFEHGGMDEGFVTTWHGLIPKDSKNLGQGVVIMTNSNSGGNLAEEIVLSVADAYSWPDQKPIEKTLYSSQNENYSLFIGKYKNNRDNQVSTEISRNKDGIQIQFHPKMKPVQLFQEDKMKFFNLGGTQFDFVAEKGKVKTLSLTDRFGTHWVDFEKVD